MGAEAVCTLSPAAFKLLCPQSAILISYISLLSYLFLAFYRCVTVF